ncbi:MAG: FAD-binding oxidoreductase [Burkholderiaceae bacterium]
MTRDHEPVLRELRGVLDDKGLIVGADVDARYRHDWMLEGAADTLVAVARPSDTEQVSRVLAVCHAHSMPVVPQGGRTGLAGGATPVRSCVALSLERLSGIIEVDTASATLTAWAGTTLEAIQEAAQAAGLFFPLDIGGRGSCQIGGNVSTNAGGNRVLRWGMAREQVLGIEAVLPDGTVLSQLNKMLKNNAGYDLKQLFIGSEGTLGVITRLVLRLYPRPTTVSTALCAMAGYPQVLRLLQEARAGLGDALSAFELMWPDFYELVTRRVDGLGCPLPPGAAGYVLIESMGFDAQRDAEVFEALLARALEQQIVSDAIIAQSESQRDAIWRVRDASGELRRLLPAHAGFDVSIATGQLGEFVAALIDGVEQRWPGAQTVHFGHVADANVHVAVKTGRSPEPEAEIEDFVYGLVGQWRGSISAEHGIGAVKRRHLGASRSEAEIALMRTLKQALDPRGILNPGKVIPDR